MAFSRGPGPATPRASRDALGVVFLRPPRSRAPPLPRGRSSIGTMNRTGPAARVPRPPGVPTPGGRFIAAVPSRSIGARRSPMGSVGVQGTRGHGADCGVGRDRQAGPRAPRPRRSRVLKSPSPRAPRLPGSPVPRCRRTGALGPLGAGVPRGHRSVGPWNPRAKGPRVRGTWSPRDPSTPGHRDPGAVELRTSGAGGPKPLYPLAPWHLGTRGPRDRWPPVPEDLGTLALRDPGAEGPMAPGPGGPGDHRPAGPRPLGPVALG